MRGSGLRLLVAAVGLALTFGACSQPDSRESLPAAAGLGSADVAVYLTQWANERTSSGRVVLYDRTGPASVVTHRGIRNGGLIWDNAGLFFLDEVDDFQITATAVERNPRSREADTVLAMRGYGTGRRVVLFNDGLDNGSNHTGVALYDGVRERSQQDLLDSTAAAIASCSSGLYLAGPNLDIGNESSELIRLDPSSGKPQRLGPPVAGRFVDDSMGAPCRDGKVVGLWMPVANGALTSTPLEVWQWQTSDGTVTRVPLKTESGEFSIDPDAVGPTVARWLDGDDLLWVDAAGTGWRTNLASGLTRKVREGMIAYFGPIDHWVLNGDYLIGFEYLPDKVTGHLRVYSAHTMELLETRELPRLAEVTPEGQQVLAIAVRPGYRPGANG